MLQDWRSICHQHWTPCNWFYIQINFTHGGSYTTYYYKLCFLKRGAIYCIVWIHEILRMQLLEYGSCFHERVDHLINVLPKHLWQVHVDPIYNKHVPELFIMFRPNYVVSNLLIIIINCCPRFLASMPISDVCTMAKCHHWCRFFFHFTLLFSKQSLESTTPNEASWSFFFARTKDTTSCCSWFNCFGFLMDITLVAKSLEASVFLFPLLLFLDLDGAIVGGKELSLLSSITLVHFFKNLSMI